MDNLNQPILLHPKPRLPDDYNIEDAINNMINRLLDVEEYYLRLIGDQIKEIGEMSQSRINMIVVMTTMGRNINDIASKLQIITGLNNSDLLKVFQKALDNTYTDQRFKKALEQTDISTETKERIEQNAQAIARQTQGQLENLSNTTAVSTAYKKAIDKAVIAGQSGLGSYSEQLHNVVEEVGSAGMPIYYESGYRRRLDTAARQNIVDAVNQMAQNCAEQIGEDLGFDAVEISAHLMSAPDHEPVQGHILYKAEFEKMQNGLDFTDVDGNVFKGFRRAIGEWNCRHFDSPFDTKSSIRSYTDDELKSFIEKNHKGCEINGKKYTIYEASQLMRKVETQIRKQKDIAIVAESAGDTATREDCQRKINALDTYYSEICKKAGLRPQRNRSVVKGFSPIRL